MKMLLKILVAPFALALSLLAALLVFLFESNGISATLCIWSSVVLLFIPNSSAFSTIAFSVGSPMTL